MQLRCVLPNRRRTAVCGSEKRVACHRTALCFPTFVALRVERVAPASQAPKAKAAGGSKAAQVAAVRC